MLDSIIRLKSIVIENFKNVIYGSIDLNDKNSHSSILGIYGQNGSGKSTVIDALALLKFCLCGLPIPKKFAEYINVNSKFASFQFSFNLSTPDCFKYEIFYSFSIKKEIDDNQLETTNDDNIKIYKAVIYNEKLEYSCKSKSFNIRKSELINTNTEGVFTPIYKFESIFGKDRETITELLVAKKIALKMSKSFIFSNDFITYINKIDNKNNDLIRHLQVINNLVLYGITKLFVIDSRNTGIISLNLLPLSFRFEEKNKGASGKIPLYLTKSVAIPKKELDIANKVIKNMNIVLTQIIPGLTIDINNLGLETLPNGEIGYKIDLISNRNNKRIPLKNESDGIKKIVSILQLLICVFNNNSITVAIDELDAGIFEYLLGEILRIIENNGKGQLIFTSHNLRPLETINWNNICFTTVNNKNRYIKQKNIKNTNNLRDVYYRNIILGNSNDMFYSPTNNSEISFAFKEADSIYE